MRKAVLIAFIFLSSCATPEIDKQIKDEARKYKITFTMGAIGYIHYCDRYIVLNNTYQLFSDGKLAETINAGCSLVTIQPK